LYDLMRVLDASSNIHYGVRPVVARDLSDPLELDVNTAFACLKATTKPIGISFCDPDHIDPIVDMFDIALGHPGAFRDRPFCMAVIVHVVPPLTYAAEGIVILERAVRAGMVPQICSAGQAGATSPVALAGALAQGLAECLAGMVVVDNIKRSAPCIYALMPFISDLRTGAMSGGGGEAAIANAAAAQLLSHVGLPSTVSAGMTDSKLVDAQAGYEKGYTVALAGHGGADMINLSVGMLGSIMVASPEAMVIDDDMCGAILRSIRGIEVSKATLDLEAVERVVTHDGHYLGESETLNRMKSDYHYPALADRQSVSDWVDAGSLSIWEQARSRGAEILAAPPPTHLSADAEARIRAKFPIRLKP
jgi:trimethylamine--corrinoid protein Co-methyltransferase